MKIIINIKISILFCFSLWLLSCANPQPPSGGPPDKTPPEIVDFIPKNQTLNFKEQKIKIKFNKYMDKNKVNESIFISPSKKMNFDWSGKSLDVEFDEPLDTNTTYYFVLGTDYNDLKGNKPKDAFSIVFSTGNQLDSGIISGFVANEKPEGTYLIAYRIDNINPDTLNINHTLPAYKTQAGTSGNFEFLALKDGTYRVFAFKKKEKISVYEEGLDQFGTSTEDIIVSNSKSTPFNIKYSNPIDKIKPGLFSADGAFENQVILSFSEPIDTFSIKNESFMLFDSLGKFIEYSNGAMFSKKSNTQLKLNFTKLEKDKKFKIEINKDLSIKDTSGNSIEDTLKVVSFYANSEKDTVKPTIIFSNIRDSLKNISLFPYFKMMFSNTIDTSEFYRRINFTDNKKNSVGYNLRFINSNYFEISPNSKLIDDEFYHLEFDFHNLKSNSGLNSKKDTTYKFTFKTEDRRSFPNISGKIKVLNNLKISDLNNILIELQDKETKIKYYNYSKNGNFSFEKVNPGDYFISAFDDSDKNGKYTSGYSFPYNYAEKFSETKTLSVKPRWNIDNVILEFK